MLQHLFHVNHSTNMAKISTQYKSQYLVHLSARTETEKRAARNLNQSTCWLWNNWGDFTPHYYTYDKFGGAQVK